MNTDIVWRRATALFHMLAICQRNKAENISFFFKAMALNQQEEENIEIIKEELKMPDERAVGPSLLIGEFNEEESKRSFQEALRQWRGERSGGVSEPIIQDAAWTPVPPGKY